ncbi:MAG: hypothetical protein KF817_12525 [Phycisphaeraceae bacterium]|nr:hypothetical protein [Phycisphaeraceae bacterium]
MTHARRRRSPPGSPAPAGAAGLSDVPVEALAAEIARRLQSLRDQRDRLAVELAAIDRDIARHERELREAGTQAGAGRTAGGRRRSPDALVEVLARLLRGRTLRVADLVSAVRLAGYESRSTHLRSMINQVLVRHPDRFRRVGHGRYTVALPDGAGDGDAAPRD